MKTIKDFIVLNRLSVKDFRIEKKRVSAAYEVENFSGEIFSTRLFYSYSEQYFDPNDPADQNLATLMLIQVAFNYGLFCKKIELDGPLDPVDRPYIRQMIENTSREIYIHKILVENDFIIPEYQGVKHEKKEIYTQAEIIFSIPLAKTASKNSAQKAFKKEHYALLSSGGKDSLLSYGLLSELGTVHPIFINESGRHWFTAVNAYRAIQKDNHHTVKPWCNSDRIFIWMLQHLAFIRRDYHSLRTDYYPIRLWTVSVFLHGVLPVAIKRGIGNIVIGNEYDTTIKGNYQGTTHYHGLYDQSKYFDNSFSRYFQRKGWPIHTFSILRSLSELLILTILVKRYPDLQAHQISCHAAHEQNGKMYPCGNCEKCRRIVGMLKALDENPERCGYTEIQIKKCLQTLEKKKVKQLGSDAAHLYHLLLTKGLIEKNEFTQKLAKAYPAIEKMRFDAERSLPEDLPDYLRIEVYKRFLPYSKGVVRMRNNKWEECTLEEILSTE